MQPNVFWVVRCLSRNKSSTPKQVIAHCGRLPLVLAIAGSLPVVKGNGLTASAWEELIEVLENTAKTMGFSGGQSQSLDVVLEASFSSLGARKRKEFLKMAVLASGAIAPIEMLLNLWQTGVRGGDILFLFRPLNRWEKKSSARRYALDGTIAIRCLRRAACSFEKDPIGLNGRR